MKGKESKSKQALGTAGKLADLTPWSSVRDPAALVQCAVEVYWPDDQCFYQGTIVAFKPTGKHTVEYTDGDRETVLLSNEKFRIVDHVETCNRIEVPGGAAAAEEGGANANADAAAVGGEENGGDKAKAAASAGGSGSGSGKAKGKAAAAAGEEGSGSGSGAGKGKGKAAAGEEGSGSGKAKAKAKAAVDTHPSGADKGKTKEKKVAVKKSEDGAVQPPEDAADVPKEDPEGTPAAAAKPPAKRGAAKSSDAKPQKKARKSAAGGAAAAAAAVDESAPAATTPGGVGLVDASHMLDFSPVTLQHCAGLPDDVMQYHDFNRELVLTDQNFQVQRIVTSSERVLLLLLQLDMHTVHDSATVAVAQQGVRVDYMEQPPGQRPAGPHKVYVMFADKVDVTTAQAWSVPQVVPTVPVGMGLVVKVALLDTVDGAAENAPEGATALPA